MGELNICELYPNKAGIKQKKKQKNKTQRNEALFLLLFLLPS